MKRLVVTHRRSVSTLILKALLQINFILLVALLRRRNGCVCDCCAWLGFNFRVDPIVCTFCKHLFWIYVLSVYNMYVCTKNVCLVLIVQALFSVELNGGRIASDFQNIIIHWFKAHNFLLKAFNIVSFLFVTFHSILSRVQIQLTCELCEAPSPFNTHIYLESDNTHLLTNRHLYK